MKGLRQDLDQLTSFHFRKIHRSYLLPPPEAAAAPPAKKEENRTK